MSKKLINDPLSVVDDCLLGLVAVNPGLQLLAGHRVVVRSDVDQLKDQVTLVSGGGSGHEPAHAGYIGSGMLTTAVAGAIFTSPPPNSILAAIKKVASPKGTVLIVKNYTGDRLNFGLAAERAKAEGIHVEMVVVGEDCALTSADKSAGRRGLAGTVLIHKIAGALAQNGSSLDTIVTMCKDAAADMATIGLSLSPCTIPGRGASFELKQDEMELGLGIHGEAGVTRLKVVSAKEAVNLMFSHMTRADSVTKFDMKTDEPVALLVNNLGGSSVLELNIIANDAIEWLESRGIPVHRAYCGTYMTSLEMAGVSLTVMRLNADRKECLDAPTSAPAWQRPLNRAEFSDRVTLQVCTPSNESETREKTQIKAATVDKDTALVLHKVVAYACQAVGNCERQLNSLDTQAGDADCGSTLKCGTDALSCALGPAHCPTLPVHCPSQLLLALASVLENKMGGSSGALYSLFLTAAAGPLTSDVSAHSWCEALNVGNQAIMKYGGAEPGDRTMLDALCAAYTAATETLKTNQALEALCKAAEAAEMAAQSTVGMHARAGRASYVSAEVLTQPDPGAHAVGIWMRAAYEACKLTH